MKVLSVLLNAVAAGLMVVMFVSIFSTAFAIGSLEEGYVTYEGSVRWQICSIVTFILSGVLSIVAATASDKVREIKNRPRCGNTEIGRQTKNDL